MDKPEKVVRYGMVTWENQKLDQLRRDECLCLHCSNLKPNSPDNCTMAEIFFKLCQRFGMAMAVSRCSEWRLK